MDRNPAQTEYWMVSVASHLPNEDSKGEDTSQSSSDGHVFIYAAEKALKLILYSCQ